MLCSYTACTWMGWDGGWRGERSCCSQSERARGPRRRQTYKVNENRLKELNKERGKGAERETETDRQTDRQTNTEVGAMETEIESAKTGIFTKSEN